MRITSSSGSEELWFVRSGSAKAHNFASPAASEQSRSHHMVAILPLLSLAATDSYDRWQVLRDGAAAWHAMQFDGAFSVNVGDESGTLFKWDSPGFSSSSTYMAGASLSKWPAAVMISGLVHDGTMTYEDLARKYLPWWTQDPADPRSRVKLWHLLSFTSGYSYDAQASPACNYVPAPRRFLTCAESLYNNSGTYSHEPGTHWAYLTVHLQLAGAMAVAASGMEIDKLFEKYLYKPFNMSSTTWSPLKNPTMAAGITTTADDFEQLLQRLLTYEVLPKTILDVMETDYSQPPCKPSGDGWFGHYGMGHWWECIGYGTPSTYERNPLPKVQSSRSSFAIAVTQPLSHAHSHTTYLPHSYNIVPSFLPHALSLLCIPTTKHTGLHGLVHPSGARPIRLLSPARPLRRRRPRGPQTAEILLPDRPARAERALRDPGVPPHHREADRRHHSQRL